MSEGLPLYTGERCRERILCSSVEKKKLTILTENVSKLYKPTISK